MSRANLKRPPFIRDGVGVIRLPHGVETIVDIYMLPLIGDRNWCLGGRKKGDTGPRYPISRGENGKHVRMHREVMRYHGIDIPKGMVTDHINRNCLDNRFENLRVVTGSVNVMNTDRYDNASTRRDRS